jgi:hypothetical protein
MKKLVVVVVATLLAAPLSLVAHHAFAAEFDISKPVKVQGAVAKVEWTNPHIWIYLDTKDDVGRLTRWQCEGASPNVLTRQGWAKDTLKEGDQVVIDGYRAKDGSNTCNSRTITTGTGKRLFAGSSAEAAK